MSLGGEVSGPARALEKQPVQTSCPAVEEPEVTQVTGILQPCSSGGDPGSPSRWCWSPSPVHPCFEHLLVHHRSVVLLLVRHCPGYSPCCPGASGQVGDLDSRLIQVNMCFQANKVLQGSEGGL